MKSSKGRAVRSLLEPPNWDGKIVLAAFYTAGYFFIVYTLVNMSELNDNQKEIATIALAALGPQLGQIFAAIYRTTASDERSAARRDETLQTAITTPGAPSAAANEDLEDHVERGSREGSRAGVAAGLAGAGGTNGDDDR